jgi:membrane-bound lytic murein transglycosylase D
MLLFLRSNLLYAQYQTDSLPFDSLKTDTLMGDLPESINQDMLRLLESWHIDNFTRPEENCLNEDTNPYFPDSVYIRRIQSMPFLIPVNYNETIRKCIDFYTERTRNNVRYIIGMSYYYFPMIEQKFDKAGLPVELKYLAIVESALNPVIRSRRGACGLWQFMLPTAKNSGLEINSLIDERLDPERSTEAACIYFQRLYDLFKDWQLVIAAYNCGEGGVLKAIRRAGGSRDFWRISPYLPRETRSFLPFYIAAAYVMEYYREHGLCPIMPDFSIPTDTLTVERSLSFEQIAGILKIDKEIIKFYNPQYKKEIIPGNVRPLSLRLPVRNLYAYTDTGDSTRTNPLDELLAVCMPATEQEQAENRKEETTRAVKTGKNVYAATASSATVTNGSKYISYTVKSGDTLSGIASKYKGVTVKKIQTVNGMTTTRLKIGQILKIPQV